MLGIALLKQDRPFRMWEMMHKQEAKQDFGNKSTMDYVTKQK